MKKHIYLFRHGQSYYNKDHVFTGWKDSRLTPLGIKQAKVIARKLKNKKIDVAFQTTLSRSKDTLKEVLKYHPECRIVITNDKMLERNYGRLNGKSHKAFVKREGTDAYRTLLHWHKIDHLIGWDRKQFIKKLGEAELKIIRRSYSIAPPRGESVKMVEKRVNIFIKELLRFMKREKVNVALSAHGNSMKQMMELENPWDDYFDYIVNV